MPNPADAAFVIWLFFVAVFDFRKRRIPNWLVLAGFIAGSIAIASGSQPFELGWTGAIAASALAFTAMLIFYLARVMGAGDVKFAGALGFWIGIGALFPVWTLGSMLAALHGLAWWVSRRWPVWPWLDLALSGPTDAGTARSPRPIPYGAYLAAGTLIWRTWLV